MKQMEEKCSGDSSIGRLWEDFDRWLIIRSFVERVLVLRDEGFAAFFVAW